MAIPPRWGRRSPIFSTRPDINDGTSLNLPTSLRQVRVRQEVERGYEVLECNLPALVTISRGDMVRRAPSLESLLLARQKPITVVKAEDLELAESSRRLQGSYTQVVKNIPPATRQANWLVSALDANEAAREIYIYLKEQHFLDKGGN